MISGKPVVAIANIMPVFFESKHGVTNHYYLCYVFNLDGNYYLFTNICNSNKEVVSSSTKMIYKNEIDAYIESLDKLYGEHEKDYLNFDEEDQDLLLVLEDIKNWFFKGEPKISKQICG